MNRPWSVFRFFGCRHFFSFLLLVSLQSLTLSVLTQSFQSFIMEDIIRSEPEMQKEGINENTSVVEEEQLQEEHDRQQQDRDDEKKDHDADEGGEKIQMFRRSSTSFANRGEQGTDLVEDYDDNDDDQKKKKDHHDDDDHHKNGDRIITTTCIIMDNHQQDRLGREDHHLNDHQYGDDCSPLRPSTSSFRNDYSKQSSTSTGAQENKNFLDEDSAAVLCQEEPAPYHHLTSPRAIAEAAYKAGVQSRMNKDKKRDRDMMRSATASGETAMNEAQREEDAADNRGDCAVSNHDQGAIHHNCETLTMTTDTSTTTDDGAGNEWMHNKRRRTNTIISLQQEDVDGRNRLPGTTTRQQQSVEGTIEILQDLWKKATTTRSAIAKFPKNKDATSTNNTPALSTDVLHALEETKNILFEEFDYFIRAGLNAFNERDDLALELSHYKELFESTNREVQRLKSSEEASRVSLSNLLKAVESSKASARDAARAAQTEARLRGEVSELRSERDVAIGEHAEARRKVGLLEEEVRLLKSRIARLTQDKIKVERDARAALSLARSMDSHAADDVEYYKRRVNDLNDHLQSKNMEIAELKNQVEDFKRHQINRSFTHSRLT